MSYTKNTAIHGYGTSGEFKHIMPAGHWNLDAAIRRGRKAGIVGPMKIEHCVFDRSGHGRSGHDGKWRIDEHDGATREEAWREGGMVKA